LIHIRFPPVCSPIPFRFGTNFVADVPTIKQRGEDNNRKIIYKRAN